MFRIKFNTLVYPGLPLLQGGVTMQLYKHQRVTEAVYPFTDFPKILSHTLTPSRTQNLLARGRTTIFFNRKHCNKVNR